MRLFLLTLVALAICSASAAQPPRPRDDPNPQASIDAVMAAADPNISPPLADPVFKRTGQSKHLGPIGAFWPDSALQYGLNGYTVLQCASGPDGVLKDCKALAVAPQNWGFDDAAIRMARMKYLTVAPDAARAKGALVRIAIFYQNPKPSKAAPR